MSLDHLFNPPGLDYYRQVTGKSSCEVNLSQDESAVILKAYDYGFHQLNKEEKTLLNAVISKLKDVIHP